MTTETILAHYNEGRIGDALRGLQSEVKHDPDDEKARWLLFQVYCICAMYDKAGKQLDYLIHTSASNPLVYSTYLIIRSVMQAELQRRSFFTGAQSDSPQILKSDNRLLEQPLHHCLQAIVTDYAGDQEDDHRIVREVSCKSDGKVMHGVFTDGDDLTSAALEVFTHDGHYLWLSWNNIERITFEAYQQPLDLLFRQARILRNGGDGEESEIMVHVPVLYPWTEDGDLELRQAKGTDWIGGGTGGAVRGMGQKCFLIGDELIPILEIDGLVFSGSAQQ